jgi:SAM-dependent methyltransferase
MSRFLNLACGSVFVDSPQWLNIDFVAGHPSVLQADLLRRLPVASASQDLVYCSHFVEHIPRDRVDGFLGECARVLRSGGLLRIVTPSLESMAREYVRMLDLNDRERAQIQELNLIDQCVRLRPGGELAESYRSIAKEGSESMKRYVRDRTGVGVSEYSCEGADERIRPSVASIMTAVRFALAKVVLPGWAARVNLAVTAPGERHQWVWSPLAIERALLCAGFDDVRLVDHTTSRLSSFPADMLDMASDGTPRKGLDSMYVEASRA